jgi:hypothetical protein
MYGSYILLMINQYELVQTLYHWKKKMEKAYSFIDKGCKVVGNAIWANLAKKPIIFALFIFVR